MAKILFTCTGGTITLPDEKLVLMDRQDGGNLIVNPPRVVWERSELTPAELRDWSYLVASTGRAMLDALPQLEGGCINYWEAGNWALNEMADPTGPKFAPAHRKVHLHLLGRNRNSANPATKWGEAPVFPVFADRFAFSGAKKNLTATECGSIIRHAETLLQSRYEMPSENIGAWFVCAVCGYPCGMGDPSAKKICPDCQGV